jgi:hypothetical protein
MRAQKQIPDGRMRILRLLTEEQKQALRTIRIEGLIMLNRDEVDSTPPETWLEYWFDRNIISEDEIRTQIQKVIYDSK